MTVPIARLVATRFATADLPLQLCYFAHAYRGVKPQRGQSREFLQAGIELIGAPGPAGSARGADAAVRHARRDRPARVPHRPRRRRPLPDAARQLRHRRRRPRADPARARLARLRRPRARDRPAAAARPGRGRAAEADPAAARRLRAARPARRRRPGRGRGPAADPRLAGAARRRAGHLRPRPRARPRLLHGRDLRGLRPEARQPARRRRPLRRPARPLRPSAARRRLGADDRPDPHRTGGERE